MEEALRQMAAWRAQGLTLPVSVNISARHLQHPQFSQRLHTLLARHPDTRPASWSWKCWKPPRWTTLPLR